MPNRKQRRIMEDELMISPKNEGYKPPRRSVREGLRSGFDGMRGFYRGIDKFYDNMNNMLGNKPRKR